MSGFFCKHPAFYSVAGINPSSLIKLSQARGVICMLSSDLNIKLREYPPRLVKKSIAGSGSADKDRMKEALKIICSSSNAYGVSEFLSGKINDNISDALAIAICCATDMKNFINA